jgi:formylglycine-generating enzyme required for sulfatase activity
LVLLPGGGFWMGAEAPSGRVDAARPNIDADLRSDESPVHHVTLDPFFASKYEMTQAQWLRVRRANPSRGNPSVTWGERRHTLLHPVEEVSWSEADWTARLMGLALPTEAQWEYAARAGTDAPWCGWTGPDLAGFANLVDQYARRHGKPPSWPFEAWDDGYADSSPVGHYRPNRFGLHDVIGNVFEWCRDLYGSYTLPTDPGDGLRRVDGTTDRIMRGGDFTHSAVGARVSRRAFMVPETRERVGLRPVRPLRTAVVR